MAHELVFDPGAFELRRNGRPVDLEPQAMSVAAYLIEHRHRLIPKEELLDEIWGSRFVSESALSTRIKQVRRAVGDTGSAQRVVKTVHGKGYRFVGEVTTVSSVPADPDAAERASGEPMHNLPQPRTELIGRSAELAQVRSTVSDHRLTAIVGIGGVGKTTLAVAAGHALLADFPDGIWMVDLVPVHDREQVVLAIARSAGLSLQPGAPLDQIARIVERRRMLFVIDNCEHVLDAVSSTVDRLLDTTSGPRFLLTSREPLGLPDEVRVRVDPLETAGRGGPAVELLEACAGRYGVPPLDPSLAADVCRELDGLPLAIELAAAQLRHLSLGDLAVRLDRRFDLLVGPRRDRHASLATVLEATWASVEEPERDVLGQLAVCPGALGLQDLIEIMDQPEQVTLAALGRLVDCSLLVRGMEGAGTYQMLETVRVFTHEHDVEQAAMRRDRLATWCLGRVGDDVVRHAFDFGLAEWCRTHHDVLDAAEAHLLPDRPDEAALLIAAQGLAMHVDDGSRAADILARADQHLTRLLDPGLRARLHITGAYGAMAARSPALLARHGTAAVEEARRGGDPSILGIALVLRSWSELRQPERALELVAEAAAVAEAAGDRRTFDLAEDYRAWHLALSRRYGEAQAVARDVLERAPAEAGYDTFCAAAALATCVALDDPQEALAVHERFLNRPGASSMMGNQLLAAAAHAAAGAVEPTARIVRSLSERLERAGQHAQPDVLVPIATLAKARGDSARARAYVAGVRRSRRPTQSMQVTCLYQQLAAALDEGDVPAEMTQMTSDEIGADAFDWLDRLVQAG